MFAIFPPRNCAEGKGMPQAKRVVLDFPELRRVGRTSVCCRSTTVWQSQHGRAWEKPLAPRRRSRAFNRRDRGGKAKRTQSPRPLLMIIFYEVRADRFKSH